MIRYRLDGAAGLARRLRRAGRAAQHAVAAELAASGEAVAQAARTHLDSPARPPVSRSGTLARSLGVKVDRARGEARIGTRLDYGAHLEFGTRRMPAYPWLGPAFRLLRPSLRPRLRAALMRALSGAGK